MLSACYFCQFVCAGCGMILVTRTVFNVTSIVFVCLSLRDCLVRTVSFSIIQDSQFNWQGASLNSSQSRPLLAYWPSDIGGNHHHTHALLAGAAMHSTSSFNSTTTAIFCCFTGWLLTSPTKLKQVTSHVMCFRVQISMVLVCIDFAFWIRTNTLKSASDVWRSRWWRNL